MKIDNLIAIRYIFPKHSYNFISFITLLSIIGIIIGNAALISVQSIFNGFQKLTIKQIVGIDPHIRIIPAKGNEIDLNQIDFEKIKSIKEFKETNPIIISKVVAVHNSNLQAFNLIGAYPNSKIFKEELNHYLVIGQLGINNQLPQQTIFIGAALAERLQVHVGQTIEIFTPNSLEGSITALSQPKSFSMVIGGIFNSNIKDYDLSLSFTSFSNAQEVLNISQKYANAIDIYLIDFEKAESQKNEIAKIIGDKYQILTWKDLNRDLYAIMRFEKIVSFAIIGIIVLIAIFNLFASLAMTVTEKQQDIAILKAIGTRNKTLQRIYLKEGLLIGSIATFTGCFVGILFVFGQANYKWFRIDINRYIIDAIPVELNSADVLIVAIFSLILCFVATIFPAKQASKVNIQDALRNE